MWLGPLIMRWLNKETLIDYLDSWCVFFSREWLIKRILFLGFCLFCRIGLICLAILNRIKDKKFFFGSISDGFLRFVWVLINWKQIVEAFGFWASVLWCLRGARSLLMWHFDLLVILELHCVCDSIVCLVLYVLKTQICRIPPQFAFKA